MRHELGHFEGDVRDVFRGNDWLELEAFESDITGGVSSVEELLLGVF